MPAAAVIPAPAAYIYIAAFKKLVVEASDAGGRTADWSLSPDRARRRGRASLALRRVSAPSLHVHLEEIEPLRGGEQLEQLSMV